MTGRHLENVPFVPAATPPALSLLRPAMSASFAEKLALTVWLFSISVSWAAVRSSFVVRSTSGVILENAVPLWIRLAFFAAFAVPSLLFFLLRKDRYWLLGLGCTVGVLPEIPTIPFIRDNAHFLIVVSAAAVLLDRIAFRPKERVPGFARIYSAYLFVCAGSTLVNFLLFQSIWQLKVGLSFLLFFSMLAILIMGVSSGGKGRWEVVDGLVEGLAWGAVGQCVIAVFALPLLFIMPFEEGNDTVFGLAFYDRYKSTMPGPVNLGMFFVAVMPVVLQWMRRGSSPIKTRVGWIYLQLTPWLVVITGSRTARVVMIGILLSLFLKATTRRSALLTLPSTVVAFYLGFYFESFPAAIRALLGDTNAATLSIKGRFFDVSDRSGLIQSAIDALPLLGHNSINLAASLYDSERASSFQVPPLAGLLPPELLNILNSLFGYGAGVGGYVRSGFPSPHTTILNLLIDSGILGGVLCCAFFIWLALRLFVRSFSKSDPNAITIWLCLLCYGAASVANGTYVPQWWGYYSVILVLASAAAGSSLVKRAPGEMSKRDRPAGLSTTYGARQARASEPRRVKSELDRT
ncbi:hypothetical protein [Bradyrhizobium genomosp. III]|uniref:hypothetical protein n=1 Tax=Bradyrhizobium genomosp. III TaxID=2683271 RepID=UPI0012F513C0|nr:hypothetical protein [Bradyrhizobium sp. CCBAU 15635]